MWSTPKRAPLAHSAPDRRVQLVSLHDVRHQVWNGVVFEFLSVIAQMEEVTLAVPRARPARRSLPSLARRGLAGLRATAGLGNGHAHGRADASAEFDICLYMCQFPREIGEIHGVRDWRRKSRIACAFVLDTWTGSVPFSRGDYRMLDAFDYAFVLNPDGVEHIQRQTSAVVKFLPTAADTLMLPRSRYGVPRSIDFLSIGRRSEPFHDALLRYCEERDRFYVHDVWRDPRARDWAAARRQNAEIGARSRYYIAWHPTRSQVVDGRPVVETALSTRYFEGASAGAVILGSRPPLAAFDRLFDWPDAVIELPADPRELPDFLDALERDPTRLARAGARNRLEALARHDWAYRWAEILDAVGLERGPGLEARLAELQRRSLAEVVMPRGSGRGPAAAAAEATGQAASLPKLGAMAPVGFTGPL